MNNVMIDLETLGLRPGHTILSIGAVFFSEDSIGETFYAEIERASCAYYGLQEDPETLQWWYKQEEQARNVLHGYNAKPLPLVLEKLSNFLRLECPEVDEKGNSTIKVWGNNSTFDIGFLDEAYARCKLQPLWKFYNTRCYRTLKNLRPEIAFVRQGQYHNALDDALSQAVHAAAILKALSK
jgi:DNA polymerase III epsilon subunit-like protein